MDKLDLIRLWGRGLIGEVIMHAGQKKINKVFQEAPGAVVVLNISRQWGKTIFGVVKSLETAFKKPGAKVKIAAAFSNDLREFILPAFDFVLNNEKYPCPKELTPKFIETRMTWQFHNKSEIKLVGLDLKPDGLRGNAVDLIILDEAGFISGLDYLHSSVIVPLITHRPNAKILIQSTPPQSPSHEFWQFVDKAKLNGSYCEFDIDSNPMLTPERVRQIEMEMGGRHTTAFRREYLCERIIEEMRAICPEWHSDEYIRSFDHNGVYHHRYEFLDIGVQRDKTICLFAFYNFAEGRLYIVDEADISGHTTTTQLIAYAVKAKEAELGFTDSNVYRRIADNSHPLLLNDLCGAPYNISFTATDKSKLHEMVGELRVWVQNGRVVVHPRCVQTIGCLESGIWDKHRAKFEHSKVYGHYDALAALIYGVRNIDQWTNPTPIRVDRDNQIYWGKKSSNISDSAKDLAAAFNIKVK